MVKSNIHIRAHRRLDVLLRRTPCFTMLVGNFIALVLLSFAVFAVRTVWLAFERDLRRFQNDELLMKQRVYLTKQELYKDLYIVADCPYKPLEYDLWFCGMLPRSQVLIPNSNHVPVWLIRKVDRKAMIGKEISPENATRCMDLVEEVYCHDSLALPHVLVDVQRRLNPTACPGVNSVPIPTDDYVRNAHIIAPAIDLFSLYNELKDQTLLSNDLIIKCPVCASTPPFRFEGSNSSCFIKYETLTPGWPFFSSYCDRLHLIDENLDSNECPTVPLPMLNYSMVLRDPVQLRPL